MATNEQGFNSRPPRGGRGRAGRFQGPPRPAFDSRSSEDGIMPPKNIQQTQNASSPPIHNVTGTSPDQLSMFEAKEELANDSSNETEGESNLTINSNN